MQSEPALSSEPRSLEAWKPGRSICAKYLHVRSGRDRHAESFRPRPRVSVTCGTHSPQRLLWVTISHETANVVRRTPDSVWSHAVKQISGTYRNGRIDLDGQVDWPDGSRVMVIPGMGATGLREAGWIDTAENRALLLAGLDAIEPFLVTPEDEAEIAGARQAVRQASIRRVREQMGLDS